jgi:hypothetical protein
VFAQLAMHVLVKRADVVAAALNANPVAGVLPALVMIWLQPL